MSHWLQITSGRGPAECSWVVYRLSRYITKQAHKNGLKSEVLSAASGQYPETCKSMLLAIDGQDAEFFLTKWEGTVQWLGRSPFRPV